MEKRGETETFVKDLEEILAKFKEIDASAVNDVKPYVIQQEKTAAPAAPAAPAPKA